MKILFGIGQIIVIAVLFSIIPMFEKALALSVFWIIGAYYLFCWIWKYDMNIPPTGHKLSHGKHSALRAVMMVHSIAAQLFVIYVLVFDNLF